MPLVPGTTAAPDTLIEVPRVKSSARFVDVNPRPSLGGGILLFDAAAIFASIGNLMLCPPGARGRIFQEDYFSGVYYLLQEPFDEATAAQLSIAIHQAFIIWEPRLNVTPSDIYVERVPTAPGYRVFIQLRINGNVHTNAFLLPIQG